MKPMFQRIGPWLLLAFITAVASAHALSQPAPRDDPKKSADELPDGEGKKILMAACSTCHGLEEVTKFRGYYTKDDWRDIVVTMVKYGAELKEGEREVLIDYLGLHLSKQEGR
jgi:cytochrome c5